MSACACPSYKKAVETWALGATGDGNHLRVYVQYILNDAEAEEMSKKIRLQAASGLACHLDKDAGKAEADSTACRCSLDAERCMDWARAVVES
jgi:hypothetical protein